MGEQAPRGTLYVIVCAAPPAAHVQDLVKLAQAAGWEVAVTATPEALAFIDAPLLEAITGFPVRHRWREPDEPESVPEANAIVVAPATFNTINRWVAGITNTIAVGTLCESLGLDAPIVAVPNVNPPIPSPAGSRRSNARTPNCAAPGANSPSTSNWPSQTSSDSRSTTTTYASSSTPPPRSPTSTPVPEADRGSEDADILAQDARSTARKAPLRHRRLRPPVRTGPCFVCAILEGHPDYVHRRLRGPGRRQRLHRSEILRHVVSSGSPSHRWKD